jgi:hypothetical protein
VDFDLVLPDRRLVLRQLLQELAEFGQLGLPLLFVRLEDGPGPSVDQVAAMEQAADGLPADLHVKLLVHQQGQDRAGPTAAEEAEVAGRLRGHPGDEDGDPCEAEANGASSLPPGQALDALGLEPLLPSVEGAGAAEEHGLDGVPGMALGQQEDDVGAGPEFGIGVLAVDLEQFVALLGRQGGHRSRVEIVRGGRSM